MEKMMNLKYGAIVFSVDQGGNFGFRCGNVVVTGCRPELIIDDARVVSDVRICRTEDGIRLEGLAFQGNWMLDIRAAETPSGHKGIALRMEVRLASCARAFSFAPFAGGNVRLEHYLGSGRAGGHAESIVFPALKRRFISYYAAMLSRGGDHLYCAAPLSGAALPEFHGESGELLTGFSLRFSFLHETLTNVDSGNILILGGDDPFTLMEEYAGISCTRRPDFSTPPACGWNSWDYYRWTITEEEGLANADFIAHDPVLARRIRRIVIDDGWQYCYGEWEANPLFPHGMEYLARELTKMGFEPGLWFAPILAEPQSRIAQKETQMLGMSEGGQPCLAFECMRRNAFILDPTRQEVCNWISALFDRYAAMGYRYFKLDFMQRVLNIRKFHNPTIPRADLQRRIIEAAAHGIAGRAQLLGCNYLFAGGNGAVDQVRIGADIHARWDHICQNAVSIAANWHLNRILWWNDPDFALARTVCNHRDPELNRLRAHVVYVEPDDPLTPDKDRALVTMEPAQAEVLLSLVLVSGGVCNLSDKLPALEESELAMLYRILQAEPGGAGRPLDLFSAEIPSLWHQKTQHGNRLLFINWGDESATRFLEPGQFGICSRKAHDFWSDEYFSPVPKMLTIAPRSCRQYARY